MTTIDLEEKWNRINTEDIVEYKSTRISHDCLPDLFIGFNKKLQRCLILSLPEGVTVNFKPVLRQHLSIEWFRKTNYIVIELLETAFKDIFNDFVLSIYFRVKITAASDVAAGQLLETFYKWSEFFEDSLSTRLSEEAIMGLLGEVIVLNRLMEGTDAAYINDLLEAWKGPYDTGKDFILSDKDLEVKTKDAVSIDVKISSEHQLAPDPGKDLQLLIVNVTKDNSGRSLNDLLQTSRRLIMERFGDLSILLRAIGRKGLTFQNASEYDNFRFTPQDIIWYNCIATGFPRLIKGEIPEATNTVTYNLRVNLLDNYIISKAQL
jgi:hypothetical protein